MSSFLSAHETIASIRSGKTTAAGKQNLPTIMGQNCSKARFESFNPNSMDKLPK